MENTQNKPSASGLVSTPAASASATRSGKQRAPPDPEPGSNMSSPMGSLSKRRRGAGVVTPNACNECRKKRVKCDGRKPCGRCRLQRDVECVYELPVRQSKEDLRSEIESLRRRQRSNDNVLSALGRSELWEDVLQRLHSGDSVSHISEWIDSEAQQAEVGAAPSIPSRFQRQLPEQGPFSGSNANSYAAFSPGLSTRSLDMMGHGGRSSGGGTGGPSSIQSLGEQQQQPLSSQQIPSQQHAQSQDSPWAEPFSAVSQDPSTGSNSRQEWNMPPESGVESRVEDISPDEQTQTTTSVPRYHGLDQILAPAEPDLKVPVTTWTELSADINLVQHLLALYFCWEYPTFASLSKEHFLHDFQEGRQRFCSAMLVNALLALGCRFSTQPNTRADPNDLYSSGDHFFKECLRLFYLEDNHHSLTTIQALGIMSIREASCGRDSESWYYAGQSIRLAIEMGLHQIRNDDGDEVEMAVKSATFWGAFALDHAWSLATGSLPQCSSFPLLPPKPAIIGDIDASLWMPYTDNGASLQRSCHQPSNVRSVYKCFCELSELVHQSLYILHSPGRPLTSRDLLHIYTQYLNWYDSIPEVLRLGHNFTPAVLFAHMYYHFSILLLFRPLIKLRIIGSSITPKDVCLQAADAIQGLLRSYSQLYTLQRTPSFVPYFVLTASIMHLAIGAATADDTQPEMEPPNPTHRQVDARLARQPKESEDHSIDRENAESSSSSGGGGGSQVSEEEGAPKRPVRLNPRVVNSINCGIADLTEMVACHHFAEQALNILRYLAKKWNIDVKIAPVTKSKNGGVEEVDSDRLLQPVTTSLNFFSPSMDDSYFNCDCGVVEPAVAKQTSTTGEPMPLSASAQGAESVENPLFWPFPMQGRPILPSGKKLEEAGFALR